MNPAQFWNREFCRGHTGALDGIFFTMATDIRIKPIHQLSSGPKGAQCPNCFTFNMPHHLPEHRKTRGISGVELTCALCGTRYPAKRPSRAA